MSIAKYRKKPVEISAFGPLTTTNAVDVARWCGGRAQHTPKSSDPTDVATWVEIPTLEGVMRANVGDYVIRGVQGEFYPCKPDIFEATYEPVETPTEEPDFLAGTAACSLNPEEDECSACQ